MSLVLRQLRSVLLVLAVGVGLFAGEGTGTGLSARYYANETLSGSPAVSRIDAQVNFAWSGGAPASALPVDSFSARWDGEVEARFTQNLTFIARTDDGVRLWIDNQLVIDAWYLRGAADSSYTFAAEAGRKYRVRMEYYEHFGSAVAQLLWQSTSIPRAAIPSAYLYPTPAIELPSGSGTGLLARYYANETLSGIPVHVRTDARVDFGWGGGSPDGSVPVESFSARWDGEIEARVSEPLTLIARTDDGVRVWLNGQVVIDSWILRSAADSTYTFTAEAGRKYRIRMEYYEHTGAAVARLWWQSANEPKGPIPTSQLYPTDPSDPPNGTGTGLLASYFANETLSGTPVLNRTEARVDHAWGSGSPGTGVPVDVFSARWLGEIEPRTSEPLTLIARTDDGVRLWIDGQLVIDQWILRGAADSTYTFSAEAGRKYRIQLEYFEHLGSAVAKLWWQSASEPRAPIPTSQLYPTPPPFPPAGTGTGLTGTYFANETLTGEPALTRLDPRVDFSWGSGSPGSPLPVDVFSVRWQGEIEPRVSEPLTLIARTDDGVRVWIDDVQVINAWILRGAADSTYTFTAQAGHKYSIRMEYFEHYGSAVAKLWWQSANEPKGPIPTSQLYPITSTPTTPSIAFANAATTVAETVGSSTVTVNLSQPAATAVTVAIQSTGSGATAPATITIPAGDTTASVPVTISDDPRFGPDRQATLSLVSPVGADLGPITSHVLTIQNTDPAPTIAFTALTSFNLEQSGTASVPVRLSAVSAQTTTVTVSLSGSASPGIDYQAPSATLQIPADTFEGTIFIPLFADSVPEQDETIILTLSAPVGATLGSPSVHTITLSDGNQSPVIANGPTPAVNPVTGTAVSLSFSATDDGGADNLTFTWSTVGTVPAPVSFAPATGSVGTSSTTTATFTAPGTYPIQIQVRDAYEVTAIAQAIITVQSTPALITVVPAVATVSVLGTQAFTVSGVNQFGGALAGPLAPTWSVSGGGTISTEGVFTAGTTAGGPYSVQASLAPAVGTATVSVVDQTPTFAQFPQAVLCADGAALTLTALGADDGGEAGLTYHWSIADGSATSLIIGVNNSNAASSTSAIITAVGTYTLRLAVRDAGGQEVGATTMPTTVAPVLTALSISPATVAIGTGATTEFLLTGADQFGAPLPGLPSTPWTVSGGGTIAPTATGAVFTAGTQAGGPHTVSASIDALQAMATVRIQGVVLPPDDPPADPPPNWENDLTVTVTFENYKTGSNDETINGILVHYTKRTEPIGVSVVATSSSGATIDRALITLGDDVHELSGGNGTKQISVPEGALDLEVTVFARKNAHAGSKTVDPKKRLLVDRTKPVVYTLLPKRFWPDAAEVDAGVTELPLTPLTPHQIWLNDEDETWNRRWRSQLTRRAFGKALVADDGLLLAVQEVSGLDQEDPADAVQVIARGRDGVDHPLTGHAILDRTSTDADRPDERTASTPQRVKLMGLTELTDSFPKDWSQPRPGQYRILVTLTDKAGNELVNEEVFLVTKDTEKPLGYDELGFHHTAPIRSLSRLSEDETVGLAWQGSGTGLADLMLHSRVPTQSPWGSPDLWRLNQVDPVAAPTDLGRPFEAIRWHTRDVSFTFTDLAGNRVAESTTQRHEVWSTGQSSGSGPVTIPSGTYARDRQITDLFAFYDPYRDRDLTGPMVRQFAAESSVFGQVGRAKKDDSGSVIFPLSWNWTFRQYDSLTQFVRTDGDPYAGSYHDRVASPVAVTPRDPEAKADAGHLRLVRPSTVTILPSWKRKAQATDADKTRVAIVDRPDRLDPVGGELRWEAIVDPSVSSAAEVYSDPTKASVKGISRLMLPAREDTRPGFASVSYRHQVASGSSGASGPSSFAPASPADAAAADGVGGEQPAGALFYEQQPAVITAASLVAPSSSASPAGASDYGNTADYWLNAIKLSPDVIATGQVVTVAIEAGFFTDVLRPDVFSRSGDYVRFVAGGDDLTVTVTDHPGKTAEQLKDRIAIVSQRLIFPNDDIWHCQRLEVRLLVGPEVEVGLLHVDVNLGAVRFHDPTPGYETSTTERPDPNQGDNGRHRMNQAMRIINIEWVRPADNTADAERIATTVLQATVPTPQVTVEGTPSVEIYEEQARLSFAGEITDLIVDQEPGAGNGPLMTADLLVDGQPAGTASVSVSNGATGVWKPNAKIGRYTADAILPMTEGVHIVTARTQANGAGVRGEARVTVELHQVAMPGMAGAPVDGGGSGTSAVQVIVNLEQIDAERLRLWFGNAEPQSDALILSRVPGSSDRFRVQVETTTIEAQVVLPAADPVIVGTANLTLRYIFQGGAMTTVPAALIETAADSERYQGISIIPGTTTGGEGAPQSVKTWAGRVISTTGTSPGAWVPLAMRFKGIDDDAATLSVQGTEYQIIEKDGWKYAANGDKPAIFGALAGSNSASTVRMPSSGGVSWVTVAAGEELKAKIKAWGKDGPEAPVARQGLEEIDVGNAGSPHLVNYAHVGEVGAAIALDHGATRVDLTTGIATVKGMVLDPLDVVSGRDDVLVLVNGTPATLEAAPTTPVSDLSAARPRSFTAEVLLTRNLELVQATAMNAVGAVTSDIMAISGGQIGADNPGSPRWSRAVRYHFGPRLHHTALGRSTWKVFIAAGTGDNPPRRRVKVEPDARGVVVSEAIVVSRVGEHPFAEALAAVSSGEEGKLLPVTSLDDDVWVVIEAPQDERTAWIPDLTVWETTDQGWRRRIQQAGAEIVSDDVPGGQVVDREAPGTVTLPLRTRNLRGGPLPMVVEQVGVRTVVEPQGPAMTAPSPDSRKAGAEPVVSTTASATAPLAMGANRVVLFPSDADGAVAPVSSIDVYAADRDFPYTSGNAVGWAAGAKPDSRREFGRIVLPPPVDTVPRGHVMLIELVAGVDVSDARLTRFLRDHDLEIVASTRWDGDSQSPGIHTTLWVRVGGDVGLAEADWAQQHGTLIRGVGGNMDERALMTDKAKEVWTHLQTFRRLGKGEVRAWAQQNDTLTRQLDRELAEGRHQLVQQGMAEGTRSFDVFDLRYSDAGMEGVYNSNVFKLSNTRLPFADAMRQNALRGSAQRNGLGALRRFTYRGHDRTARRSASANTGEMLPDQSPRVFFDQQPVDTFGFTQGLQNADGLVVVMHGFNVGQGRDGDEGESNLRIDLADDGDPYRLLASYWPVLETTLRSRSISGAPVITDQTRVLHVWWSGTFDAMMDSGAYFNIDMATAHITGREKLGPFLLTLVQSLAQVPGKRLPITLLAESLGNRVATSAARFLYEQAPEQFGEQGDLPLRFVMVHPALRQIDLTPSFVTDLVEEQSLALGQLPRHPYPQSPLLGELGALSSASAEQARTLAIYSPFDKAGLSFLAGQRDDPSTAEADTALPTPMLGRVGPLGVEALPGRALYAPAANRANLRGHQVGGGDVFSTDFWHVDLFGWSLPGVPYRSRHLFERNVSNARTEARVAGSTDVRAGLFALKVTKTPSWHQITIRPSAVQAAWTLPRQLIQQGHVPER